MDKFLTIELDDIESVPKVTYKGEDITGRIKISFDWESGNETGNSKLNFKINHLMDGHGITTIKHEDISSRNDIHHIKPIDKVKW